MKNLWIFGDSFCDPKFGRSKCLRYWEYVESKNVKVEVFGEWGTGPDRAFQLLIDRIEQGVPEDTHLIFLMSNLTRINFSPFLRDPKHAHLMLRPEIASTALDTAYIVNKRTNLIMDFLVKNYLSLPHFNFQFYQWASLIYHLRHYFSKTIVWTIFSDFVIEDHKTKHLHINKYGKEMVQDMQTDNFKIITYPLAKISQENCNEIEQHFGQFEDNIRNNHFGADLHHKLGVQINNWLHNNKDIDINALTEFKNGIVYPRKGLFDE